MNQLQDLRWICTISNGCDVALILLPPYATSARCRRSAFHVVEDEDRLVEIGGILCNVIYIEPGQTPPTFIVIKIVQKMGVIERYWGSAICVGKGVEICF